MILRLAPETRITLYRPPLLSDRADQVEPALRSAFLSPPDNAWLVTSVYHLTLSPPRMSSRFVPKADPDDPWIRDPNLFRDAICFYISWQGAGGYGYQDLNDTGRGPGRLRGQHGRQLARPACRGPAAACCGLPVQLPGLPGWPGPGGGQLGPGPSVFERGSVSLTCRAHSSRPPVCRDYPWYGREPGQDNTEFAYVPQCSYLLDLPPGKRPAGSRPLIPLEVL